MDILNLPDDVLIARGKYSTANSALKKVKEEMQRVCNSIQSDLGMMLKLATGDHPTSSIDHRQRIADGINNFSLLTQQCEELITIKRSLYDAAYSNK